MTLKCLLLKSEKNVYSRYRIYCGFPPIKMGVLIFPRDHIWTNQLSIRTRNRSPDYGATQDASELATDIVRLGQTEVTSQLCYF